MSVLEDIAKVLKKDKSKIKLDDIKEKIPTLKRAVNKYERLAIEAESSALANRARAFSPDTKAPDRASLMRKSMMDANRAKTLSGFASTFLTQLGSFLSLQTTMEIANQMNEAGLINADIGAMDWQNAMDTMQVDIEEMIATTQKLGYVMNSVLAATPAEDGGVTDELDQLFAKFNAETDPVKKEEIRKNIEAKTGVAYV